MTADTRASRYLVPVLLSIGAALAALNWYLAPAHARSWASALIFVACLAVVWRAVLNRVSHRGVDQAADSIRNGIVFGVLIIIAALAARLAAAVGAHADDLSRRLPMIVLGLSFVFVGNAMPKMLTPLSALHCDPARVQALQRFAGWTWVLMGLAYAAVWALGSRNVAEPLSTAILLFGTLAVFARVLRLWQSRHNAA
jgi:hypothetical protein